MAEDPPRRRMSLMTIVALGVLFLIITNPTLYTQVGVWVGVVLMPLIGFGGRYPVLTLMIAGTLMVLISSVVRHFTTDWLNMARSQAHMREFQKEMGKARKENNTYRMKKLQDKQPEVMKMQQEMSTRQLKTMPMTMLVFIPIFSWLFVFLGTQDYPFFSAPWNSQVDLFAKNGILFGSSLLPHWILLYSALSIPLGALVQKGMKYLSWKERWKERHPEVHDEARV